MKHLSKGKKLGRVRNQRRALMKTMLGSLIMREKMNTTEAKAKEVKSAIDKVINKAKKGQDVAKKVAVMRDLRNEIPAMALKKIMGEFIVRFDKRNSGYTRIIKLDQRISDSAKMAVIEFVD